MGYGDIQRFNSSSLAKEPFQLVANRAFARQILDQWPSGLMYQACSLESRIAGSMPTRAMLHMCLAPCAECVGQVLGFSIRHAQSALGAHNYVQVPSHQCCMEHCYHIHLARIELATFSV